MIGRRLIPVILLLYMAVFSVNAQNVGEMRDTIRSSRIVSDRIVERDAGTRIIALPELRSMVSATGDADVIKYIQTLPGVSTGAEGSSAIYVRGGNIGSNLTNRAPIRLTLSRTLVSVWEDSMGMRVISRPLISA